MMSLDPKKKKILQEFISVAECSEENGLVFLKDSKWNFDQALDAFFSNPVKNIQKSDKSYELFFDKYKDSKQDLILQEGIEKFCEDLGIDPMNPVILVISYYMNSQEMVKNKKIFILFDLKGIFTKNEFIQGMKTLNCENIEILRKELKKIEEQLFIEEKFRKIYAYIFDFAKEKNARGLNFKIAQGFISYTTY